MQGFLLLAYLQKHPAVFGFALGRRIIDPINDPPEICRVGANRYFCRQREVQKKTTAATRRRSRKKQFSTQSPPQQTLKNNRLVYSIFIPSILHPCLLAARHQSQAHTSVSFHTDGQTITSQRIKMLSVKNVLNYIAVNAARNLNSKGGTKHTLGGKEVKIKYRTGEIYLDRSSVSKFWGRIDWYPVTNEMYGRERPK